MEYPANFRILRSLSRCTHSATPERKVADGWSIFASLRPENAPVPIKTGEGHFLNPCLGDNARSLDPVPSAGLTEVVVPFFQGVGPAIPNAIIGPMVNGAQAMLPKWVILSPDALFQELDGEAVILDLNSSSYFGVDGVGVRLWQILREDPSLERALDQLVVEYDVSREQLEKDIDTFLKELGEAGLVTVK